MKSLKQVLTGADNETHDVIRWIGLLGALVALFLQAYVVVAKGASFDFQAFGIGMGALVAAIGAGLGLKKDTEPRPAPCPEPAPKP